MSQTGLLHLLMSVRTDTTDLISNDLKCPLMPFVCWAQIMFADALKSRLIAEERWLEGGTRGYPLGRAAALAADVRGLGGAAAPGGPGQLDQIRLIITGAVVLSCSVPDGSTSSLLNTCHMLLSRKCSGGQSNLTPAGWSVWKAYQFRSHCCLAEHLDGQPLRAH